MRVTARAGVYDANEENNPGTLIVQTASEGGLMVVPFTVDGKDHFLAVSLAVDPVMS